MNRFGWVVVLLLIALVAVGGYWEGSPKFADGGLARTQTSPRRIAPSTPSIASPSPEIDAGQFVGQVPAAPASRFGTNLVIERDRGPRRGGTFIGTAWALAGGSSWLSARHVTDGCRRLSFWSGRSLPPATGHPSADISAIATGQLNGDGLELSRDPLQAGDDVYLVGFPGGDPAVVYGTVTGTGTLDHQALGHREAVIVVAQRKRVPSGSADLSGISGGPVLDGEGHVIGTVIGGSERRARSIISTERNVAWLAATAGGATSASLDSGEPDLIVTPANFVQATSPLLADGSVRVVRCER